MDRQEIYPTPKDMISRQSPTTEPPAISKPNFLAVFISESILFFISLVTICILSFILTFIFRDGMISQQGEYMGELGDALSLVFVLPTLLIVFGILSLITRNWTYIIYPIFVFSFGQMVLEWPFVNYLAGIIPVAVPADAKPGGGSLLEYGVAVQVAYILTHFTLHPAFRIFQIIKDKSQTIENKKPLFLSNTIIFILGNMLLIAVWFGGYFLLANQTKERSLIYIPNHSKTAVDRLNEKGYKLYYINQSNKYTYVGDVNTERLKEWWNTDTRQNCGSVISYGGGLKYFQVVYDKTSKGVVYGSYVIDDVGNATYNYCFVAGNFKYWIERRESETSNTYIAYPIEDVIDDIMNGEKYQIGCLNDDKSTYITCFSQDKDKTDKLKEKFDQSKLPTPVSEWVIPGVKKIFVSQEYVVDKELAIPEWGVAIPLSKEIKQATLGEFTQFGNRHFVRIMSTNPDGQQCIVGNVMRVKADEIIQEYQSEKQRYPNQDPPYIEGVVIGDYVYKINEWGDGKTKCVLGTDNVQDVLIWSNVYLHKI